MVAIGMTEESDKMAIPSVKLINVSVWCQSRNMLIGILNLWIIQFYENKDNNMDVTRIQ